MTETTRELLARFHADACGRDLMLMVDVRDRRAMLDGIEEGCPFRGYLELLSEAVITITLDKN